MSDIQIGVCYYCRSDSPDHSSPSYHCSVIAVGGKKYPWVCPNCMEAVHLADGEKANHVCEGVKQMRGRVVTELGISLKETGKMSRNSWETRGKWLEEWMGKVELFYNGGRPCCQIIYRDVRIGLLSGDYWLTAPCEYSVEQAIDRAIEQQAKLLSQREAAEKWVVRPGTEMSFDGVVIKNKSQHAFRIRNNGCSGRFEIEDPIGVDR